ncbi:MAG: hypothetical protein A2W29_09545, partial [Gemmatimonadetes bacterium RBG_16_66_8]
RSDVEPVLVGARRGIEATLLPQRSHRFYLLPAEPLYRRAWWRNVRSLVVAPWTFAAARRLLVREAPAVVVATGGYACVPVLAAARLRHLPIVLQEANAMPGLATRWFARVARQVHLGFPEAADRLRTGHGTVVTTFGNPVAPPPSLDAGAARRQLGLPTDAPVVFAFGGSQGSHALNRTIAAALDMDLLSGVALCWGTGAREFERFRTYDRPPAVLVRPFWDPIAAVYRASDVVVARAGAMTTSEVCAYGLPAILIPLPGAAADHQTRNAEALMAAGAARHIPETDLTPTALAGSVRRILRDPDLASRMSQAALKRAAPGASRRIAEAILELAG